VSGSLGFIWPFAAMHQREVLAAGGGTFSDVLHIILGSASPLLMLATIGFGAAALGKGFRLYSLVSIAMLLVFSVLVGIDAPRVPANLPTPLVGVWERILIGMDLLWDVVLAVMLLRARSTVGAGEAGRRGGVPAESAAAA